MKDTRLNQLVRAAERRPRQARRRRHDLPALEWAEDAAGLCPRVTAIGSRSLLVENHTGLLSLTDEQIVLSSRSGPLCVTGSGMTLCGVRSGALIIRGAIRRVELPCEGGDRPDEG